MAVCAYYAEAGVVPVVSHGTAVYGHGHVGVAHAPAVVLARHQTDADVYARDVLQARAEHVGQAQELTAHAALTATRNAIDNAAQDHAITAQNHLARAQSAVGGAQGVAANLQANAQAGVDAVQRGVDAVQLYGHGLGHGVVAGHGLGHAVVAGHGLGHAVVAGHGLGHGVVYGRGYGHY